MIFAPDTEVSLNYVVSLVNTSPSLDAPEQLRTVGDLLRQMDGWGWTGRMPRTRADLDQVLRVRERLRALWGADVEQAVEITNALLRDGQARPQLVIHEPYGWHIHGTDSEAPVAVRMAVEAAMAFIDVIRLGALDRLATCAGEDCDRVLIDLTKNRSRRFCDTTCANRAHAAAYRARKASE